MPYPPARRWKRPRSTETAMGCLEDLTAAVEAQTAKIDALAAEVAELRQKVAPSREIYRLRDLAELPESPSLKVLRNHPERQPAGGVPDGYRGGAKAWYAATVAEWRRQLAPGPAAEPFESRLRVVQ